MVGGWNTTSATNACDHTTCHGCNGTDWVRVGKNAQLCPVCHGKGYARRDALRDAIKRRRFTGEGN